MSLRLLEMGEVELAYKIEESTAIVLTLCANAARINIAGAMFIKVSLPRR